MTRLANLSRRELLAMRRAGAEVLACYGALARGSTNLVLDFLRGMGTFEASTPYPPGAVADPESLASFYYHAHRLDEHGHFHTFILDGETRPTADGSPASPAPYTHLVAIRVDDHGIARGLFATNRWVTGETYRSAAETRALLPRFAVDHASPSWLVNRWITALVRLFRPQIEQLLVARDAALATWARRHPGAELHDAREARELEIPAEIDISIDRQIAAVERALASGAAPRSSRAGGRSRRA